MAMVAPTVGIIANLASGRDVRRGHQRIEPEKLFVLGLDQWREEDVWPLPDTRFRRYYLHSGGHANTAAGDGTLSTEALAEEAEEAVLQQLTGEHNGRETSLPVQLRLPLQTSWQ